MRMGSPLGTSSSSRSTAPSTSSTTPGSPRSRPLSRWRWRIAGLQSGDAPAAPYPASKGAAIQLTKDLANEWAPKGILVNAIAPGWVRTPMTEPMAADPEFTSWMERRVPLGRWAKPEEMAGPVILLAAEAGSFMTGSVVVVDGGLLAVM